MIVDSSAVMAILQDEPEANDFIRRIAGAGQVAWSVMGQMECSMLELSRRGEAGLADLRALVERYRMETVEITLEQGRLAIEAFRRYGRGRHPARLNMGDCFAYALAKSRNQALLFKGDDFSRTDVTVAG